MQPKYHRDQTLYSNSYTEFPKFSFQQKPIKWNLKQDIAVREGDKRNAPFTRLSPVIYCGVVTPPS
jgi:hypothetical protein